jgi:hypothetical protein
MWGSCQLFGLLRLLARNRFAADRSRRGLMFRALLNSVVSSAAGWVQQLSHGNQIRCTTLCEPPLFVLGHWRSGTTFLHDLLSTDPHHTFPNTYECFMPLHFLLSEDYFVKHASQEGSHRGSDNVPSGWHTPQEDEFALALLGQPSPYLTLAFPNNPAADPEYLDLERVTGSRRTAWKRTLLRFLQAITLKRPGRMVLKSPPHTARIKVLLEQFPDARFAYIVRNPFAVVPSTMRTFSLLYQKMGLQEPTGRGLEEYVFDNYRLMFRRLDGGRQLVSPERFCEVHYEDVARDPVGQVRTIYHHLRLGGFESMRPRLEAYVASLGTYQANRHHLSPELRSKISQNCIGVLDRYGYREDAA